MGLLFASLCTPLAKSGRCGKWQGRSLGKIQFLAGFGLMVSLFWDQGAPLAQHKTFSSGFQLCRMQCCSQPWCSAQPAPGAVNEPGVSQDLQALPGGLAQCLPRKCHQDCSCLQQNPYPVQRQQNSWLQRPRITGRAFTSPTVMYKIPFKSLAHWCLLQAFHGRFWQIFQERVDNLNSGHILASPLKVLQEQNVFLYHQKDYTEKLLSLLYKPWLWVQAVRPPSVLVSVTSSFAVTACKGTYMAHTYLTNNKKLHNKKPKTRRESLNLQMSMWL